MKKILLVLIALGLGYWAATHQQKIKDQWSKIEAWFMATPPAEEPVVAEETSEPLPAPKPKVVTPPPAPSVTPLSRYQPLEEGVYYTRERITQVTDAGISVINARTRVTKTGEENGRVWVDDGKQKILTSMSSLTNDPAEVGTLLQQAAPAPDPKSSSKTATRTNNRPDPSIRAAADAKWRQYDVQIIETVRQMNSLTLQLNTLQAESRVAKGMGRPSTYNDRSIANLQQRITALEAHVAKLRYEQANIKR